LLQDNVSNVHHRVEQLQREALELRVKRNLFTNSSETSNDPSPYPYHHTLDKSYCTAKELLRTLDFLNVYDNFSQNLLSQFLMA
jgi:hypothetical protein